MKQPQVSPPATKAPVETTANTPMLFADVSGRKNEPENYRTVNLVILGVVGAVIAGALLFGALSQSVPDSSDSTDGRDPGANKGNSRPATQSSMDRETSSVKTARVISSTANVRTGRNPKARVLGVLRKDSRVQVLRQSGPWFLVEVQGSSGWVHGNTIELEK